MLLSIVIKIHKMQYLLVVKMSDYTESLSADDVADYKAKLTLDNGMILPDPFGVDKSQRVNDVTAWPPLAFADIFQYFVVSRHYSLDESKNWKTLDRYIITLLTVMSNKFCCICHMSMTDIVGRCSA